jgi:hypothetical protein
MKKLIAGLGLFYFARKLLQPRRTLEPRHGLTLLGFGAVAAGVWFGMRALHSPDELPPRMEPWTSRKKQRHEERVAAAKAREQATVRPPLVRVEKDADTTLRVPLKDLTS